MKNIWMVITLHDNDYWDDLVFLGETITSIMRFYDSIKLPDYVLTDRFYIENLKRNLLDLFIGVCKLQFVLSPSNYLPGELKDDVDIKGMVVSDNERLSSLTDYFNKRFKLYFTEEELNTVLNYLSCSYNSFNEIKYVDELKIYNGNSEYIIIHCCDYECKYIII